MVAWLDLWVPLLSLDVHSILMPSFALMLGHTCAVVTPPNGSGSVSGFGGLNQPINPHTTVIINLHHLINRHSQLARYILAR